MRGSDESQYPTSTTTQWVHERTGKFHLKALLDRWEQGQWVPGNCVDAAAMTMLGNCSTGVDFRCRGITGDLINGWYFRSNPLCLIGNDPRIDANYRQIDWTWHTIATVNGEPFSAESRVWDATAAHRLNLSAVSYRNPPAHHVPSNHFWPLHDYWQKPTSLPRESLGVVSQPLQGPNTPRPFNNGLGEDWKPVLTTEARNPPG